MSDQVYSTGRRKESIARVWISNGTGNITINKKNKILTWCSKIDTWWGQWIFIKIKAENEITRW